MFLAGPAPLPGEYRFLAARASCGASCPADVGERVLVAVDCANESRIGADRRVARRGAVHGQHRPPPRQLPLRRRQPRRRRRVVDRRGAARPLRRARRRADARDRRAALRRPRHRHRPLPVREHDAEGAAARGRAGRGRRGRAQGLPGRLRDRPVREAEAARARARAGAGVRGRRARRLVPRSATTSRRSARRSRTRRGSSTSCAPVEGADMAALIREPPRDGGPARRGLAARAHDEIDVSRDRAQVAAAAGTGRRPASRATPRSRRSPSSSCASSSPQAGDRARAVVPPRALEPSGIDPRRQAGRARRRSRSSPSCGATHGRDDGPCGNSRPVRDRVAASAAPARRRDSQRMLRRARQALPHGGRPHGAHDDRRSGGRASSSEHDAPTPDELEPRSTASAARSSCRSRPRPR